MQALLSAPPAPWYAVPLRPPRHQRGAPAIPQMLTAIMAWRMLCAKTGAGIALETFYLWIRYERVRSIRMGKKIYIPRTALDELVNHCLNGEKDW